MTDQDIPVECAACGFFIGSGLPGGTYYCSQCENFVVAKAKASNIGSVLGALAIVVLFIGVGAIIADALRD